ncbi:MAG: AAA family ATPase [Nitrospirae bacterium]|nr:AAA family ATPase [Nitrospirota bacterium]
MKNGNNVGKVKTAGKTSDDLMFNAEIYLSCVDKVVNEIRNTIPQDGVITISKDKIVEIVGDSVPSLEVLKGTPSLIFKLQRLGKKVELSLDKQSLLIVDRGVSADVMEKAKEKIRLSEIAKKEIEEKVEPEYYTKPPIYEIVKESIIARETVFAFGMPGCGKSELFNQIAKEMKASNESFKEMDFERFEMLGDMSKEDIFGFYDFKEGIGTVFNDGKIPKCMKEGKFLCIEEIDVAPNEVLMALQKMLEKNGDGTFKTLHNPMNGEEVIPHPNFRLSATANTCGKGDETSLFPGTHPLNDAFLDRWSLVYRMDYVDQKTESYILKKKTGIEEKLAREIADFASKVRQAFIDGKIYSTFSMRRTKNFATQLKRGRKMNVALKLTALDRVSQEDARAIMEIANRIWGVAVSG